MGAIRDMILRDLGVSLEELNKTEFRRPSAEQMQKLNERHGLQLGDENANTLVPDGLNADAPENSTPPNDGTRANILHKFIFNTGNQNNYCS